MSQTLESKPQWERVLGFGKVGHLILVRGTTKKTLCGHSVDQYDTKKHFGGKKCGLCVNVEKLWSNSVGQSNRYQIDYEPSEIIASGRHVY